MAITDVDIAVVAEVEEAPFEGKTIDQLKKLRTQAEEAQEIARALSRRDTDWFHNFNDDQWTDAEKTELASRGQPVVTMNLIKPNVNFTLGFEQRGRTDPKAFPRNPADELAADVATDVMDYIEQSSRFDREASLCFKDMALSGIEACEVIVDAEEGDIKADRIDVAKFFYDPRSREPDFSDARYMGYADWYDLDEANELFPGNEIELSDSTGNTNEGDEDKDDKPWMLWEDAARERVLISVVYYKVGLEWRYAYHTGSDILDEGVSAYLDDKGRPANPIIAQSLHVTRENERYGIVRDMIGPQMEVNFRRSMSLWLLKNRRMWQAHKGVFDKPKQAKAEASKADGLLTANGVFGQDWGFIDSTAEIAGNFELMQDAKSILDLQGANAGLRGRGTENQSGKAIVAQQNAGTIEENDIFDAHNDFKVRTYEAMWFRAKQFWTEEKFIRVTDDENAFRFAHVNAPAVQKDQDGNPIVDPMTGQPIPVMEIDPQTGQPVQAVENRLAEMDVDIVIDAGPDTVTMQAEHFNGLINMVQAGVPIPPDILIAASALRNKKELLEKLEEAGKSQVNEAAQLLEFKGKEADINKTDADAAKSKASAIKTTVEAQQIAATPPGF